mgnify:CR=1 FL=1
MNDFKDRLLQMKEAQAKLAKDCEAVLHEYESNDLIQENQLLRADYEDFKQRVQLLKQKESEIEAENSKLRQALQEQILDEKLNILKISKAKLDTYFANNIALHNNRLVDFEWDSRREIKLLIERANKNLRDEKHDILTQLEQTSLALDEKIKRHRETLAANEKKLLHGISTQYDQLSTEEVTEEVMQKRAKQNQIEMKIGLNWINKLGILLIIFGVGAAFKHSYSNWMNDYVKGSLFFILGALMMAGGEWLYRKNKQTFALGLLGGGISVLYGSIFFSYFLLDIIGLPLSLLLSVMVTLLAVVLSLRYHSRTVCSFGLVGGYFPLYSYIIAFGLEGSAVYAAMGYLLMLNVAILLISSRKQWNVVHYISFVLNIPTVIVLINLSENDLISMGFAIVTFLVYLGITLSFSFIHKAALKKLDIALLAANTFISCGVLYYLFDQLEWNDLRGLLALIFCVIYLGLGRFMERVMRQEKQTMMLFYGTSLTFAILIIPFQFGVEWLSLGWLVEAMVLMMYGNSAKLKSLEKAGWLIFTLCLGAFYIELFGYWNGEWSLSTHFNFNYTSIMIGMVAVTVFYALDLKKQGASTYVFRQFRDLITFFKYFTLANLWIYCIYESTHLYQQWVPVRFVQYSFYETMLIAFITIGLAYALTKVMLLYDRIVKYYCLLLYTLGCFICLYVTLTIPTLQTDFAENSLIEYLALGLLIAFNVLIFFSGRDLLLAFIRQQYKNIELYPTILAVYLLGIIAAFLSVQFQLGEVGLVFSSVFLVMAIGYILYGFRKRYVYIRRLGLGLTLLSTGKLFLFDLAFLTESSKIAAYFCFGIALLGISYIYQRVSSRQEAQSHVAKE